MDECAWAARNLRSTLWLWRGANLPAGLLRGMGTSNIFAARRAHAVPGCGWSRQCANCPGTLAAVLYLATFGATLGPAVCCALACSMYRSKSLLCLAMVSFLVGW